MPTQPHSGIPNRASSKQHSHSPTWLLVRGLCRQQLHWEDFPVKLAQQLNNQVLCCDIPGTGTDWQRVTPASITGITLQLRLQFRQENPDVTYPIRLLGISMGGMICTEWAKNFPNEIENMVFINTSFKQFSPIYQRLKFSKLTTLIRILSSAPLDYNKDIIIDIERIVI